MSPDLLRIGAHASPVVVIDDFSGETDRIVEIAASMAPFPRSRGTYYPGLRRPIENDGPAWDYVTRTMRDVEPFVGGGFDADGFDLTEASFSMVTARPETLDPAQRAPHFDSTDSDYIAILHYLGGVSGSGTAFYRQLSTGIERVTEENVAQFVAAAQRESGALTGYTRDSNRFFEQIACVEAVRDRLVIYQGRLLHSGVIPADMSFSADPRVGRLTANFFIVARREGEGAANHLARGRFR
jgi:hypothetical protein